MPLPNFHSCRLLDPKTPKDRVRTTTRTMRGKPVSIIWYWKGDKSRMQAVRFNTKTWDAAAARSVCKSLGGRFEPAAKSKESDHPSGEQLPDVANGAEYLVPDFHCPECEYVGDPDEDGCCIDCGGPMEKTSSDPSADERDWDGILAALESADDFLTAETLVLEAAQRSEADTHKIIMVDAQAKLDDIKAEGRELFVDDFQGTVEILEHGDGKTTFRAIVGQVDIVNKNKRLYPRKEIVKNLQRVNMLAETGDFLGLDGHPGIFGGGDTARDVAVKFTKVMLKKKDIHAEGQLMPTDAGREVGALWGEGVFLQWSIRGYGKLEPYTDKNDEWQYDVMTDYILDGIDIVLRGAADTKTVQVTYEDSRREAEGNEMGKPDEVVEGQEPTTPPESQEPPAPQETAPPAPVQEAAPEAPVTPPPVAEAPAAPAPAPVPVVIDMDAITASVATAATEATQLALAADRLGRYKAEKLIAVDATYRLPVERALAAAATTEAVDEVMASFAPLISAAFQSTQFAGAGIISSQTPDESLVDKWYLGGQFVDRPETAFEAKVQLIESVEDNHRVEWDNPRIIFGAILDEMEKVHPEYFTAVTRSGYKAHREAATTTTVLSPILPQVLPMLRQLFPQLIPYEISSVQPLKGPTGRVYWLNFQTAAGVDLSSSSLFDSTWADHEEADTKSQISLDFETTDLTTVEKAIYYSVTSMLIQDMKALHGLDAEAELIDAAVDQIAREINATFLETLRVGATAGNVNYGTAIPAGTNYTGKEWRNTLMDFLAKANGLVSEKVYNTPDWIVVGPGASPLLECMQSYNAAPMDGVRKFGKGLTLIGTLAQWKVYKADWFARNIMLLGYKPPTWNDTGAVYAPYIPLYISPQDYDAPTNVAKRAVASRYAMAVLRGNAFATITVQMGTAGAEPF